MYLVDYHMHSKYSFDGECQLNDMCETAIKRGLSEIAVTDHMDIFSDKPYGHILDCESLYKELSEIKEIYGTRLKVLAGIELGQPQMNPAEAEKFMNSYKLDFIIGSVHNIFNDVDAYDFNYKETPYKVVFDEYMKSQIVMAKEYNFDVLGHITYPSRYVMEQTGVMVDWKEYYDEYETLLKTVIERGRGIEINLSGIARGYGTTMPDVELLKFYRSLGGEIITVGSDAHRLEHIGVVSSLGYDMLREMGFKYVATYEDRKVKMIKL